MTTVSGVTGTTTNQTGSTSGTSSTSSADQFDENTFLKLLVAQLQYQDPENPADATQFMSQTAQFAMVEKLSSLATINQQMVTETQSQTAASLVGRTVSWTDSSGTAQSGVVTAATLGASPSVTVGGTAVPVDSITSVTATPTGTSSTGTSSTGTSSTG